MVPVAIFGVVCVQSPRRDGFTDIMTKILKHSVMLLLLIGAELYLTRSFFQVVAQKQKNYMSKKLFPIFLEFIAKATV